MKQKVQRTLSDEAKQRLRAIIAEMLTQHEGLTASLKLAKIAEALGLNTQPEHRLRVLQAIPEVAPAVIDKKEREWIVQAITFKTTGTRRNNIKVVYKRVSWWTR